MKLPGFTFLEIIIVMAIVMIVSVASAPLLSNLVIRINYQTANDQVLSYLHKAQMYTMEGKNNTTWGVCTSGSNLILFTGSCASPTFSEIYSIPQSLSISGLTTQVTFTNKRGEPDAAKTIVITSSTNSTTIQLNLGGGIQVT